MIKYTKHSPEFKLELENNVYKTKRYNHQEKCFETQYFIDDIFCFDIEVSSFFECNGKWITAKYAKNQAELEQATRRIAVPYIWQFGINDNVFFGRYLFEFKKLLDRLYNYIKGKAIIYIHNISYEFAFLEEYLNFQNNFFFWNSINLYISTIEINLNLGAVISLAI